jgi:hypothetical protein
LFLISCKRWGSGARCAINQHLQTSFSKSKDIVFL